MNDYYKKTLAASRLQRCYELAPPRVKTYLEEEVRFAHNTLPASGLILELGCGYGRVLEKLYNPERTVVGIDTALASLMQARETHARLYCMNANRLGFKDRTFEGVACIQNGIAAFGIDPQELLAEAIRVTRPGGIVLFSSYTRHFWKHRLEWFKIQSEHGLVGEIDWDATGNGVIQCKDGFRLTTLDPEAFEAFTAGLNLKARFFEVDRSSLFCELRIP